MKLQTTKFLMPIFLGGFFIASFIGCTAQINNGPAAGIKNYLNALVNKDEVKLINSSCVAWEDSARQELRTFDAVQVTLESLQCTEGETNTSSSLVSCSGKVVANYGNEVLEIDLAERNFKAIQEDGEWRMCGYQ